MDGLLNIFKPQGITSYDVIRHLKQVLRNGPYRDLRIGHAGTLDPFAEGVLLVLLGRSTKQSNSLMNCLKTYEGVIHLGIETETGDKTGRVTKTCLPRPGREPKLKEIKSLALQFIGEINQVPPMYSAIHYRGKRLYELARQGITVKVAARKVTIKDFKILSYNYPKIHFVAQVGKGTYLRSLAVDFGHALGIGGHLSNLVRSAIGPFSQTRSLTLESLSSIAQIENHIISFPVPTSCNTN